MKKNIPFPLAILIIFLVIVAIVAIAFLLCPKEDGTNGTGLDMVSTTTRTETDYDEGTSTEDWQTYKNEQYGFEMKYPLFLENDEPGCEISEIEDTIFIGPVSLMFLDSRGLTLDEWINKKISESEKDTKEMQETMKQAGNENWQEFGSKLLSREEISVAGEKAVKLSYQFIGAGFDLPVTISLKRGGQIYDFRTNDANLVDEECAAKFGKKPSEAMELMLSTLGFIEPVGTCIDNCGNGTCEEIVCLAIGCPCAETKENCPRDCGAKTEPETIQLEIKNFTTDKKTYTSNEELKASLTVLSLGEAKGVIIKLTGIKPYNYAYINSSQTVDLNSGENEIIFTATTPYCTAGCGGVYPGPYDLNAEIFVEENLIVSSTISINLTNE